jgi:hypothetical protein
MYRNTATPPRFDEDRTMTKLTEAQRLSADVEATKGIPT